MISPCFASEFREGLRKKTNENQEGKRFLLRNSKKWKQKIIFLSEMETAKAQKTMISKQMSAFVRLLQQKPKIVTNIKRSELDNYSLTQGTVIGYYSKGKIRERFRQLHTQGRIRMTMKDIARRSGVSVSTVSRMLMDLLKGRALNYHARLETALRDGESAENNVFYIVRCENKERHTI